MHREGHHGLNALLYAPIALGVAFLGSVELAVIGAMFFVGTASIPDFDRHFDSSMNSHRSDLWHLVPIKHRGFTHTVWFAVIAGVVGASFGTVMAVLVPSVAPEIVMVFAGVCTMGGVLGHILGDMMTPMGVCPLSPIRRSTYSLNWFLAKNTVANYGFLFVGGIALLAALGAGFQMTGVDLESYTAMVFAGLW